MTITKTTRRATFETNSSSSHTITLGNKVGYYTLPVRDDKSVYIDLTGETYNCSTPDELAAFCMKWALSNQDFELFDVVCEVIKEFTGAEKIVPPVDYTAYYSVGYEGGDELFNGDDWKTLDKKQVTDYLKQFIFGGTRVEVEDRDLKYERENGYDDCRY